MAWWGAVLVLLLFICRTFGQPLNIAVSSAQYSTWVYGRDTDTNGLPPISRTTISSSPISDGIDAISPLVPFTNHADASAGLFEVSVFTDWAYGSAAAQATNQLWFSPLVDQVQAVGLQFSNQFDYVFTYGSISLLDLTANSKLWNYYWTGGGYGYPTNNLGVSGGPINVNFNVDTDFLASHQYLLTMTVGSSAKDDGEIADIQLTGLQVVPEPSSVCLLLVALLALRTCPAVLPYAGRTASKRRRN